MARFEDANWPRADLVNASLSLPFCPPDAFPSLWERIVRSLRRGGRFSGQLSGDREKGATIPTRTRHTRAEVEALLQPFDVELLEESEWDETEEEAQRARRTPKHWHVFDIVARKRESVTIATGIPACTPLNNRLP